MVIMPKSQVGSFISMLIRPLESSISLFYLFIYLFMCNETLLVFSLLLIGILLLRPYESIKTSDSY